MTYHVDQFVRKIEGPISVSLENSECKVLSILYRSGAELAKETFSKPYIISYVDIQNNMIHIHLKENTNINLTTWIGESQVSFM